MMSDTILNVADNLERLELKYNFAVISYHNEKKQNDIRENSELIKTAKLVRNRKAILGNLALLGDVYGIGSSIVLLLPLIYLCF